eukprot:s38_g3.t1
MKPERCDAGSVSKRNERRRMRTSGDSEEQASAWRMKAPAMPVGVSSTQAEAKAQLQHLLKKTAMCRFFLESKCSRGRKCSYAHSKQQPREKPDFRRTKLCWDFESNGNCKYGALRVGAEFWQAVPGKVRAVKIGRKFASEVEILSKLQHPHILRIRNPCQDAARDKQRIRELEELQQQLDELRAQHTQLQQDMVGRLREPIPQTAKTKASWLVAKLQSAGVDMSELNSNFVERALTGGLAQAGQDLANPTAAVAWRAVPNGAEVLMACGVPGHGVTSGNLAARGPTGSTTTATFLAP